MNIRFANHQTVARAGAGAVRLTSSCNFSMMTKVNTVCGLISG